jgi:cell division protein FtsL
MKMNSESLVHLVIATVSGICVVIVFAYSTFATIRYVDDKAATLERSIAEMKADAHDTKQMVIELYRDQMGKNPRLESE